MVFGLPNILTYSRILAVPALAACFYFQGDLGKQLALGIFVAAAITDFFDGYLARIWNQQSALGRMLDPIADKLIVAVSLLMLVSDHTIYGYSIIAAIIILCREILVSGLREFLAELHVSLPVTLMAKWKTTIQMVAIAMLLASGFGDNWAPHIWGAGLVALWLAALMTLFTGYSYFRTGLHHVVNA